MTSKSELRANERAQLLALKKAKRYLFFTKRDERAPNYR